MTEHPRYATPPFESIDGEWYAMSDVGGVAFPADRTVLYVDPDNPERLTGIGVVYSDEFPAPRFFGTDISQKERPPSRGPKELTR